MDRKEKKKYKGLTNEEVAVVSLESDDEEEEQEDEEDDEEERTDCRDACSSISPRAWVKGWGEGEELQTAITEHFSMPAEISSLPL